MHRNLLSQAFKKAKEELNSDKITHLSQHLSDYIVEDSKEAYGEKTLRVNYNKLLDTSDDHIYLKEFAAEALSHYLGFTSFAKFIQSNPNDKNSPSLKYHFFSKKNNLILVSSLLIITALLIFYSTNRQRWMVWDTDHYTEVKFDTDKYKINQLKLYKKDRIEHFKKIIPTCNRTTFFNADGSVNVWYGKNRDKKLEYFTALGLHPETGKTLKPITTYMIKTHLCN